MCGHTVICSKHDEMNKNAGSRQNCMAPFIGFVHPFCISQSIVEAGGTTAGPTGETQIGAATRNKTNTPFELRDLLKQPVNGFQMTEERSL